LFEFWYCFFAKPRFRPTSFNLVDLSFVLPYPAGEIVDKNRVPFVKFLLGTLQQVSNKNTQQLFYLTLIADFRGLTSGGKDFLKHTSGLVLSSKVYGQKKKAAAAICAAKTTQLFVDKPGVFWMDNFNPSWAFNTVELGQRKTEVMRWTVAGFTTLPLTWNDLRLKQRPDGHVYNGLPQNFPMECVELLFNEINNLPTLNSQTTFTSTHNVTSFPFDLSAQFTPTVSQQTVDDFREAGKLSSYFPVTINKFDSSSHTSLYQDLMWYKGFCDMDRSDKYFLLITDQNLYVRIVKVCYYLSLLQHTQGGCQSGTIILIYNLKQ